MTRLALGIIALTSPPPIRVDLQRRARRPLGRAARAGLALLLAVALLGALGGLWIWRLAFADLPVIPDKAVMWSLNRPPGVTFQDKDGAVIAIRGSRNGQAITLAQMPRYLPNAFLAAEDRRFYSHHGLDLTGIARALRADVGARHVVQGGSTITQQVVRNIFLSPDQTLKRKVQEAILAWSLERRLSKTDILELYLNRIYFGDGAYGVEAAAETYFGKPASQLTLQEAALLAALPKAPSRLDPANDLDDAVARSKVILGEMRQDGWITSAQQADADAHPPVLAPEKPVEGDFGYILDLAASRARDLAQNRAPDLVVRLTVDPRLQDVASRVVREGGGARPGAGRRPGRAGGARPGRGDPRPGRRQGPPRVGLRPRHPGDAPARLFVQAVRLCGGAGGRGEAVGHAHRLARQVRRLVARQLRRPLLRRGDGGRRPGALDQHHRRAPRPPSWRRQGGRDGPALRPVHDPVQAPTCRWRSAPMRSICSTSPAPTRCSSRTAIGWSPT